MAEVRRPDFHQSPMRLALVYILLRAFGHFHRLCIVASDALLCKRTKTVKISKTVGVAGRSGRRGERIVVSGKRDGKQHGPPIIQAIAAHAVGWRNEMRAASRPHGPARRAGWRVSGHGSPLFRFVFAWVTEAFDCSSPKACFRQRLKKDCQLATPHAGADRRNGSPSSESSSAAIARCRRRCRFV